MENIPLISVIVPVYNGKRFLSACLESLKTQTYSNFEIIIVDDGSTDGSPELVTSPAQLIYTRGRTGAGAARNLGAKSAKGDYLLFTDCDVEAPPDWIEKTVKTIQKKNVKCGGGGYAGPVEDTFIQWFAFEELAWRRRNFHGEVETLVSNNLFCERRLFNAIGGFPEDYCAASSEDMEFSWKVSRQHKLWWDKTNGVYHNFAPTPKTYLRQQARFARDAVPMVLSNKGLVKGKTHHPRSFYLEIALTGLAMATLLCLQLWVTLLLTASIVILNTGLLAAMYRHGSLIFTVKSISLILTRNLIIIFAALHSATTLILKK
ncbi:glycosyltransferase [Verrucomicrobiota bacterium]